MEPRRLDAALSAFTVPILPKDLDSELDLPCRPHRIQLSEAPNGRSGAVERLEIVDRSGEISAIQNVEEVGSELDIEALRDSRDFGVLEHGVIDVEQSGPDDCVAT